MARFRNAVSLFSLLFICGCTYYVRPKPYGVLIKTTVKTAHKICNRPGLIPVADDGTPIDNDKDVLVGCTLYAYGMAIAICSNEQINICKHEECHATKELDPEGCEKKYPYYAYPINKFNTWKYDEYKGWIKDE